MYRYGTGTRSNGIYCEPDTTGSGGSSHLQNHHHFSTPPHMSKKSSLSKSRTHSAHRRSNRPHHTSHHRNDNSVESEMDSSSEVSDGTFPDSDTHHGINLTNRLNMSNGVNGGVDSPPEPAPSDHPVRLNGLRSLKPSYGDGDLDSDHAGYHIPTSGGYHLPHQEYLMSSPYQPKSPLAMGSALATAKKLFQTDNLPPDTIDSNSTLSTLPSQARLVGGPTSGNLTSVGGIPSAPVILPVFPTSTPHVGQLATNGLGAGMAGRTLPRNHQYSPARFTLQKDCHVSDRCSWKCISVALILLCAALISILIYFAAVMGNCSRYTGSGCIFVEDDVKVMARGEKHPVIELTSISPKPNEVDMVSPTSLVPEVTSSRRFDAMFNEGLTPVDVIWGQPQSRMVDAYSYWTLEINLRESALVNLNFSFPWGSNWALLFRKNVLPTVTQHDLVKIIKNGRMDHRTRRRHVRHAAAGASSSSTPDSDLTRSTSTWSHYYQPLLLFGESEFKGDESRIKRDIYNNNPSADLSVALISQYLDSGKWFLRLLNDDYMERRVKLLVTYNPNAAEITCPQQCSEHGNCVHGKCHCLEGFAGPDCSISICPVLCSNHGMYVSGVCHCNAGWKGTECDIPESECEIANCHEHGNCVNGKCSCSSGWAGDFCDQRDCADPSCSQHGRCIQGKCLCENGWTGRTCNFPDSLLEKCVPDCSEHGQFSAQAGKCVCQKPYTGPNCNEVSCEADCGKNGKCNDQGKCECKSGWSGDSCDGVACDPRCEEHGQCKNGTCLCSVGWNGKHCTLAGCSNSCSHHGSCIMQDGQYSCKCSAGWAGSDCSVRLETNCSDNTDNDEDGMSDCADSECCDNPSCREHMLCMSANDPVDVLLRKQPPSVTSSFFHRVKFLIEEDSVQSYAQKDEYSERRVSVIRGQVLSPDGLGIVGIRVGISGDKNAQRLGFTLTRKGGWFDILVNGGGSVTLQFQRNPFRPLTRTVFVPWNEIVVLDPPVTMSIGGSHHRDATPEDSLQIQEPCSQHDPTQLRPIVLSSWFPNMVGAVPDRTVIFAETQILQESIGIPGSDVHLLYHSNQSPGYLATIMMQLTGAAVPPGLSKVHLKITIEGELYQRIFEADPNITHTFGWGKRNVYQQKVYGVATARVAVGYEYTSCAKPIWTVQTVTLKGFDVDIADVGGWNLDIHHHYNFHEGILQKGDGSQFHLKQLPRLVTTILGRKGLSRPVVCDPCDNAQALLLQPIALTTGPDGSLYVGDYDLIRRITPDGQIYTILKLTSTKVTERYFITVSPADGHLYVSDPEKYQVLRVNAMEDVDDPRLNWSPVVGSGQKCVPGDRENCGDGFNAKLAKLSHPKGLAITKKGSIYIADGPNIRFVDSHGIIHTLVGSHAHRFMRLKFAKPTDFESCRITRAEISRVQLHWPTNLALNLLENSLVFVDEGILFRITDDNQIERVLKCDQEGLEEEQHHEEEPLPHPVRDLAFSPKGRLYFVTEDSNLFTLRPDATPLLVKTDKVWPYSGNVSSETGERIGNNLDTGHASAITIGPDSVIYVADLTNLELKQVSHFLPVANLNGEFEVPFPSTGEMYVFNRYGQHTLTKDLKSGKTKYTFAYTKNTSLGKLNKITDMAENKILFLRDYSNVVSTIENTQGKKCSLKINDKGKLEHFQENENSVIRLEYTEDGLLQAKTRAPGTTSLYSYNHFGRVHQLIGETGTVTRFQTRIEGPTLIVQVTDSAVPDRAIRYQILRSDERDQVTITKLSKDGEEMSKKLLSTNVKNASCTLIDETGIAVTTYSWAVFPLLRSSNPVEGNLLRGPSSQFVGTAESPFDSRGNKLEWRLNLLDGRTSASSSSSSGDKTLDRQMWVNDSRVLTMEFDQSLSREVIYNRERESIFSIQYDTSGLPLYFIPASTSSNDRLHPMNITYDRFNRIENWKWGEDRGVQVSYGRSGFASELKTSTGKRSKTIEYNEYGQPSKITLPSGRNYSFKYDLHGGLRTVTSPKNTHHTFTRQTSIGFTKLLYSPPGYDSMKNSFVNYWNPEGLLLSTLLPEDAGRIFYEYDFLQRPTAILYSEGKITYNYKPSRSLTISVQEAKFEVNSHVWTNPYNKIIQTKIDFTSKSGLASGKFMYDYDSNLRPVVLKSRIAGTVFPELVFSYHRKTGQLEQLGSFRISQPTGNETVMFDGTAIFTQLKNGHGQPILSILTVQSIEVARIQYTYVPHSHKIHQLTVQTNSGGGVGGTGFSTSSSPSSYPIQNFSYDVDGQLISVETGEPWTYQYDPNGNLEKFTYRRNDIPLEYDQMDRIIRFGDGTYKYDEAGRVIRNARDEFYSYNALGHLRRVWKNGRFDIEYSYDHLGRLVLRKDNLGNTTQFFYADLKNPTTLTHIYSPRETKLMHLVYDSQQRLIFVQVNRNQKYYVATDHCGTPLLVFDSNGRLVQKLLRSPYGHVVHDSDPHFYLPVDYCGGIVDKVTILVHTRANRVYDPLIGQFLTPHWQPVIKDLKNPQNVHLYRLPANDPINMPEPTLQFDHQSWLTQLGYDLESLSPQLFPAKQLGVHKTEEISGLVTSGLEKRISETVFDYPILPTISHSVVTKCTLIPDPAASIAQIDPPLGKNILLSRTSDGKAMISCPFCTTNRIYRDVYTTILNGTDFIDYVSYSPTGDVFHFIKKESWKASDDLAELHRLGSHSNVTHVDRTADNLGIDIKIPMSGAVLSIKYGMSASREATRLIHHAKTVAQRKAWANIKDQIRNGLPVLEFSTTEKEEITRNLHLTTHHVEFNHNPDDYPFFADDPHNVRLSKKSKGSRTRTNGNH